MTHNGGAGGVVQRPCGAATHGLSEAQEVEPSGRRRGHAMGWIQWKRS